MIGMPAALALASEPLIASALGTETARPSTFCETAASISCACFCGSLFDGLQMSLTPSSLAACSAPFLTTDQNEPSSLCVTIANVRPDPWVRLTSCEPDAAVLLPVVGLPLSSLLLLPPHPAATSAASASTTTSSLPTSRFIGGTPSLSSEPVLDRYSMLCDIERRTRVRPGAPSR